MFNLDYFKFLVKSKKYLIIFEILVTLLLSITSGKNIPRTLLLIFALFIAYIAPFNTFSFVHDKKAIDSYFSLPVKRQSLLFTGLVFCIAVVYLPYELGIAINSFLNSWSIDSFVLSSLVMLLAFVCLIVFNTLCYFVSNNKLDGIVATGAYTILPYAFFLVCICFIDVFVCGGYDLDYETMFLVSPIYNVIILFSRNVVDCINHIQLNVADFRSIGALVLELVISVILLFSSFNKRKVEIAETVSKRFFAYPLIIALYCTLCMFGISCNFSFDFKTLMDFLADNMLLYIILFVLFVAANFIYQRKFYFNFKMLAYYLSIFVISLVFCFIARTTKGFNLANMYVKNDPNVYYQLNFNENEYDEHQLYTSVFDWFNEKTNNDVDWTSVNITAKKPTNQKTIDFFETKRINAIDEFYNKDQKYSNYYNYARLNIYNNCVFYDDVLQHDQDYYYSCYDEITIDELLELAKDPTVTIIFYADQEYRLDASGELLLIEYTETLIEKVI